MVNRAASGSSGLRQERIGMGNETLCQWGVWEERGLLRVRLAAACRALAARGSCRPAGALQGLRHRPTGSGVTVLAALVVHLDQLAGVHPHLLQGGHHGLVGLRVLSLPAEQPEPRHARLRG